LAKRLTAAGLEALIQAFGDAWEGRGNNSTATTKAVTARAKRNLSIFTPP
jgi:hypothetical protein